MIEVGLCRERHCSQFQRQQGFETSTQASRTTCLVVITQFDQADAIAPYIAGPQQLSNLLLMESALAGLISLTRVFCGPGRPKPCAWRV